MGLSGGVLRCNRPVARASGRAVTPAQYLGVVSVPLPPAEPPSLKKAATEREFEDRQRQKEQTQVRRLKV